MLLWGKNAVRRHYRLLVVFILTPDAGNIPIV